MSMTPQINHEVRSIQTDLRTEVRGSLMIGTGGGKTKPGRSGRDERFLQDGTCSEEEDRVEP